MAKPKSWALLKWQSKKGRRQRAGGKGQEAKGKKARASLKRQKAKDRRQREKNKGHSSLARCIVQTARYAG